MAIKTVLQKVVKKKASNKKPYPKIMVSGMHCVLFSAPNIGTILQIVTDEGDNAWEVGEHINNIPMRAYSDHAKPVTIQNM